MARLVGNYGLPPWEEVLASGSCKYSSLRFAHSVATPWVSALVDYLADSLPGDRDHTVVDVKVWPSLGVGHAPALVGWHLDCVRHVNAPYREERHALYQAGAGCYTSFKDLPTLSDGDIVHYGREIHTATLATRPGPRLLVRVTQCDQIKGSSRPFRPTILRVSP